MTYREIDGIKMSSICMGCWNIAGDWTWGAQDEKDSVEAVKASLSAGVNFFDTAEAYGDGYSEELLGKVLSPVRKDVVIATKTARAGGKELKKACENSLRRLKTDYADIYYLHWPDPDVPFGETAGALLRLKKEGKIRMPAVSNFGKNDLSEMLEHIPVKINQVACNLLFRAAEHEILPFCAAKGVSAAAYSPLAEGLLTGKFKSADEVPPGRARTRHFAGSRPKARHGEAGFEEETFSAIEKIRVIAGRLSAPMARLSLAWLLGREGVGFVVAGARNAVQARANAKAADLNLPDGAAAELDEITSGLKRKMGANPDMWQHEPRIR